MWNQTRIVIAIKDAMRIETVVKHEGEPLAFELSEQKVCLDMEGNEINRYAYHITENGKHGVETIFHCTLKDAMGVAKLIKEDLQNVGIQVSNVYRKEYNKERGVQHFFFDINYNGEIYEVGVHLAKLDSKYYHDIGRTLGVTYINKATGEFPHIEKINNVIKRYCF